MFPCKLMVVGAFESYKRGDYIYDQNIIAKICDPSDLMHGYESKVRKMPLSQQEMKMYLAPEPVVIEQPVKVEMEPVLQIESIKDDKNKSSKSKGE